MTPLGKIISVESIKPSLVLIVFLINSFSFIIYELLKPLLKKVFKD